MSNKAWTEGDEGRPLTKPFATTIADFAASIVVFLVAVPLCLGIAIASGVPVAMGLISGIIGGVVVGTLAGSPLQVSGPAAGLAVIVFGFVDQYGIAALGPVLVLAGVLQILAGFLRIGSWFRAISPAVVHGMLAGIGILIILGQIHVLMDAKPAAGAIENVVAIDETVGHLWQDGMTSHLSALLIGLVTLAFMLGWEKLRPQSMKLVPGALIGVFVATLLAAMLDLSIRRVELPASLFDAVTIPGVEEFARLQEPGLLIAAIVIAVIASAETLLSAAAVDRMHDGRPARFNKELFAQGIGNGLCGMLGGLPITGVIVRSSANVQAGAKTRLSTIMHGTWILCLIALAPQVLAIVPLTALAAVLLVTGWRLVSLQHVRTLFGHYGWMPVAIWTVTVTMVVVQDLLVGVTVGLALSLLQIIPHLRRRFRIERQESEDAVVLNLAGAATCTNVPSILSAFESVPPGHKVELKAQDLQYLDHTCAETISEWLKREKRSGRKIEVTVGGSERHSSVAPQFKRFYAEVA